MVAVKDEENLHCRFVVERFSSNLLNYQPDSKHQTNKENCILKRLRLFKSIRLLPMLTPEPNTGNSYKYIYPKNNFFEYPIKNKPHFKAFRTYGMFTKSKIFHRSY